MDLSGPSRASVICTLGMHRSGTSLVSRMLGLLGVRLGPDERVLTAGGDNPKGYWEHRSFVDLNDDILARFGGRWDEAPAFPPSWPRDPRIQDLREKARNLLKEDFAEEPLWGWKDPRTCLTLPFWQDLIGPMRYVMCVRNPCAVVASLTRRNGMSSEDAERLWLTHVQASLAHTSGQPRLFVFYEDVIDDWPLELRRMATFIGGPERADDPRVHEAVEEFVENEMCHHRMSMEDLAGDPRISFPTQGLYLAMRGHARPRSTPVSDALDPDRAGRSVQKALDLLGARALETQDRAAAQAAECHALTRANQAQAATIATLSSERDERALREQRSLVSIASLESDLRSVTLDRDAQARKSEAALEALEEVHRSSAWRLVTFIRKVIVDLLPAGTRRRRIFNSIVWRVARRLPSPRRPCAAVDLRPA